MQVRDTDRDWEAMAQEHPYYAVITDPRYHGTTLSTATRREFFDSGEHHVALILEIIRNRFDSGFKPHLSVDFGCGVGRISLALARVSDRAIGVDVSETMIALARKHASDENLGNIEFLRSGDELSQLPAGYDLLTSVIVFQHIPPHRGYVILAHLLKNLTSGGYFYLQITFAKGREFLDHSTRHLEIYRTDGSILFSLEDASPGGVVMSMYDYDLNKVFLMLMKAGVENVFTNFTDHGGCYGVVLLGRKT